MKTVKDIKELAEILNISITTISRVLNGKSKQFRISPDTSKKVLDAAQLYNYTPNRYARGLKTTKTGIIGLIIPDISNPFFSDFASIIELELKEKGYLMILCDSRDNIEIEEKMISLLMSHKVEGIIIAPVGTTFKHILHCNDSGTPLVVIDRVFPELDLPFVTSDNFNGALEATKYLLSMGHTSIACLQGIPDSRINIERVNGYIKALEMNNRKINTELILGDNYSINSGYVNMHKLLALNTRPTAILALSNLISLGAMRAVKEIGIRIPHDVSIISFDDNPYSEFLWVPMTTINQNKKQIGCISVDILLKEINGETNDNDHETSKIYIDAEIVYRDSVLKI